MLIVLHLLVTLFFSFNVIDYYHQNHFVTPLSLLNTTIESIYVPFSSENSVIDLKNLTACVVNPVNCSLISLSLRCLNVLADVQRRGQIAFADKQNKVELQPLFSQRSFTIFTFTSRRNEINYQYEKM